MKSRVSRSHEEASVESFRRDPQFAADHLSAVLEDGDLAELLQGLRYLAQSRGGVAEIARRANLNATTLYRTLSRTGNPEIRSLQAVLRAVGLRLAIKPIATTTRRRRSGVVAAAR